ncbi:hypothetical protein V6N11_047190 [Hibiscus sabdariffa]|uniref:Cupin type-1 domain-containing protein n=2 Tax=Hibiscus sabdariffa TaxID=183260 RepID=A0ABR2B729_9ROSI
MNRHSCQCCAEPIPGLNTLGISLARIDYAPNGGLNPSSDSPWFHRDSRALGRHALLYVDFVSSNPDNRLITKFLNKGDVFVFPVGLIHFQFNVGKTNAVAIVCFEQTESW